MFDPGRAGVGVQRPRRLGRGPGGGGDVRGSRPGREVLVSASTANPFDRSVVDDSRPAAAVSKYESRPADRRTTTNSRISSGLHLRTKQTRLIDSVQVFTSHSTQNRSLQRRSSQAISWRSTEETKPNEKQTTQEHESSVVAEMGDRLATRDIGRKVGGGCCAPFRGGTWVSV